ncbi:MAG TPA: ribosome small subunit-dependent GTPase A [Thermomicrobiales bacterium]|jgi:ribosome biogenesis GTPase
MQKREWDDLGKKERLARGAGMGLRMVDGATPVPLEEIGTAPEPTGLLEGLIVNGSRGMYQVETEIGPLLCTIRGRLRKNLVYAKSESTKTRKSVREVKVKGHDPVAVGDRVRVLPSGGGAGTIEEIVERAGGSFTRNDPNKGGAKLTSIAGLDQIVATFAATEPTPHLRVLDRLLVLAEAQEIAASICIGKADLGIEPWLAERLDVYRSIGYPVLIVSAHTGEGVEALRANLAGKTSALLGPSGVGKSSLLNALQPELGQLVGGISGSTGKGRHTTTGTRLFPLDGPGGGYLADTAGFRSLSLAGRVFEELDWCFREFRPFLGQCRMNDCTHLHEPDCAVRAALAAGQIDRDRYDSFRRLRRAGAETLDLDTEG